MKETQATAPSVMLSSELQLQATVNAPRGSMDAAGYKHVVLLLILLKYIPDASREHRNKKRTTNLSSGR